MKELISGSIESHNSPLAFFYNKKTKSPRIDPVRIMITAILASVFFLIPLAPAHSEEFGIEIQSAGVLTLQDAVSIAIAENPKIENAALDVSKAGDDIAVAKTKLLPELGFNIYELYHLTEEAFTFKEGSFGDFPIIGPIPSETTKIRTAPDFTTYLTASIAQPLSQLYDISLLVNQRRVERELFDQELRATRQEIADRVKKEYYNILKTQSGLRAKDEKIVFLTSLSKVRGHTGGLRGIYYTRERRQNPRAE